VENFWKFWYDSPFLSLIMVLGISGSIYNLCCIPNRILRHLSIRKHGWPPEHLDGDGDFRKESDND
jgi:hypothetical protein